MTNQEILDDLAAAAGALMSAQRAVRDAMTRVTDATDLPAAELTEDAIVAVMISDTKLAGYVFAKFALNSSWADRNRAGEFASVACSERSSSTIAHQALQSLAVALAAASYRGA